MMQTDGQKKCGKVMNADKFDYEYIVKRYNRKSHINLISKTLNHLITFFDEEKISFLCSWFCERDIIYLKRMGYDLNKCYFYDFDKIIHEKNMTFTDNCFNVDIIFDDIRISGVKIHRYCEYTYPVGKIYDGNFILVGNDDDSLHICNPINSIEQLIEQNELEKIYHTETWNVRREYDSKQLNYYMVIGCK